MRVAMYYNNDDVRLEEMLTLQIGFSDFRYMENVR